MTCHEDHTNEFNAVSKQWTTGHKASVFFNRMVSSGQQFAKNQFAAFKIRRRQRLDRQLFRRMNQLEDHILNDIGVTRGDLDWASHQPMSVNASDELNSIREETSQARMNPAQPKRRN